jgi:antitoxin (DNA-binding transcriptional repressor) of toxin-antitoxin stability system
VPAAHSWLDDEPQGLGVEQAGEDLDRLEIGDDEVAQHAANGGADGSAVLAAADRAQHLRDVGDDASVGLVLVEDAEGDDQWLIGVGGGSHRTVVTMLAAGWDARGSGRAPLAKLVCHTGATLVHMAREVSVRELRNSTAAVVQAVRAGERLTLTVNRDPVADIVPHVEQRDPWVASAVLREIVEDAPSDRGLLDDLADVRGALLDDA